MKKPLITRIRSIDPLILYAGMIALLAMLWSPAAYFFNVPAYTLDDSWALGLAWAEMRGLQIGTDIIFPYGPLYYLHSGIAMIQATGTIFTQFLFANLIYLLVVWLLVYWMLDGIRENNRTSVVVIALIPLVALFINPGRIAENSIPLDLAVSAVIILLIQVSLERGSRSRNFIKILAASALTAILSLVKLNYAFMLLLVILISLGILVFQRKWQLAGALAASYVLSLLVGMLLSGIRITEFPQVFANMTQPAAGYSEAMVLTRETVVMQQQYLALILLGLLAASLGWMLWKRNWLGFASLLLISPAAAAAFKEGFVRGDGHYAFFYAQMLCLAFCFAYVLIHQRLYGPPAIIGLASLVLLCLQVLTPSFLPIMNYTPLLSRLLNSPAETSRDLASLRQRIREAFPESQPMLSKIDKNSTIDILPADIMLLYAYELNWAPRPTMQCCVAHTEILARANGEFFGGETAPELVLYSYEAIDGRYPLFEDPPALQQFISHYTIRDKDDSYLLLEKRAEPRKWTLIPLTSQQAALNQDIPVPGVDQGLVFCNLNLELSPLGKLFTLVFKIDPLKMTIKQMDGSVSQPYRIIRQLGPTGFLLSRYARDLDDVAEILEGNPVQDVASIKILGRDFFYQQPFSMDCQQAVFTTP